MPIGTLNTTQFNAMSSIMTLRAQELVSNMIVMDVSGANRGRSGGGSGDTNHAVTTNNFSVNA